MSAQDLNLNKPVRYRKPRADVYTLLLGIALVALILACVFAFLEVSDYGDQPFSGAPIGLGSDAAGAARQRWRA